MSHPKSHAESHTKTHTNSHAKSHAESHTKTHARPHAKSHTKAHARSHAPTAPTYLRLKGSVLEPWGMPAKKPIAKRKRHRAAPRSFDCPTCGGTVIDCLKCDKLICIACEPKSKMLCMVRSPKK